MALVETQSYAISLSRIGVHLTGLQMKIKMLSLLHFYSVDQPGHKFYFYAASYPIQKHQIGDTVYSIYMLKFIFGLNREFLEMYS